MKRSVLTIAAVFVLLFVFAQAVFALEPGAAVSDFELKDMEGKTVRLGDYRGKTVVINFWATWCPPCKNEMPDLGLLDKELKQSGQAVFLAVNMTDGKRETKGRVEKFVKENGLGMRVLLDTGGTAAKLFNIRWLPTTVVIDGKGILRWQVFGETTKEDVLKAVADIK